MLFNVLSNNFESLSGPIKFSFILKGCFFPPLSFPPDHLNFTLYPQCYRAGRAWGIKSHKCLIAFHPRLEIGVQLFGSVVIA